MMKYMYVGKAPNSLALADIAPIENIIGINISTAKIMMEAIIFKFPQRLFFLNDRYHHRLG